MKNYRRAKIKNDWVIYEAGKDWERPSPACTFAFDTETFAYVDGIKVTQEELTTLCRNMTAEDKRKRVSTAVWCWQCYDEVNGFFMTSSFDVWVDYQAKAKYQFGWCYNAKFDFSQIDYQILTNSKWKRHVKRNGRAYNRGQAWAYDSIHNDMGSRYAYKLWIEYRHINRHKYVHPVEYRDFMNIFIGGLAKVLESLDVRDNTGAPIRKLKMDYQDVNPERLTQGEIEYCVNDVKGLYYAIKQFNTTIEEQSNNERHIFGELTNVMTAGGFAKAELLRSLYPDLAPKNRLKEYQREHPITIEQDAFYRRNHLYRGGISLVNERYRGKLVKRLMRRYDVNSEYPFALASIRDLVGEAQRLSFNDWQNLPDNIKQDYECIYMLTSVSGDLLPGYVPTWFDPFKNEYVKTIQENGLHLMFEREFAEMSNWYDLDYTINEVIVFKRGGYAYKNFVDVNYELKAQAKRDKNIALSNVVKLKLNSSYGKLAERVTRGVGEYRYNELTGAIHFVNLGEETDAKCIMNVVIGALVTSVARIWILSHIREICKGEQMEDLFVYIDTDSIHTFAEFDRPDAYALGGLKLEAVCPAIKYIAPKTYFDVEELDGNQIGVKPVEIDGKTLYIPKLEIHTKGVNISSVTNDFLDNATADGLSLEYVDKRFNYGEEFDVLCAMNVKGGKVLIPTKKYLARWELAPGELITINTGYAGSILSEI